MMATSARGTSWRQEGLMKGQNGTRVLDGLDLTVSTETWSRSAGRAGQEDYVVNIIDPSTWTLPAPIYTRT